MRITVYYQDGKVTEFNTETFTYTHPFGRKNVLTEFTLRLDRLALDGLMLDMYINDIDYLECELDTKEITDLSGRSWKMMVAGRKMGCSVYLIAAEEMGNIAKIMVDGNIVAWRQGEHIINAVKYFNQEFICYSHEGAASVNRRVTEMFAYLQAAYPQKSDQEICQMFGYSYEAYLDATKAELAQLTAQLSSGLEEMIDAGEQDCLEDTASSEHNKLSEDELEQLAQAFEDLD